MFKNAMKKKCLVVIVALMVSFALGMGVQAAVEDPFSKEAYAILPEHNNRIVSGFYGKAADLYITPKYSQEVKITASSSNKKVAAVKILDMGYEDVYQKGVLFVRKGYGTAQIKVVVEIGGETFEKTFNVSYYKYENPFSSFKINGRQYKAKLDRLKKGYKNDDGTDYIYDVHWKAPKGVLKYALKKKYEILEIEAELKWGRVKRIKNNGKIPAGCNYMKITYRNKKTKAIGVIDWYNE